jgi:hypothetical protein
MSFSRPIQWYHSCRSNLAGRYHLYLFTCSSTIGRGWRGAGIPAAAAARQEAGGQRRRLLPARGRGGGGGEGATVT